MEKIRRSAFCLVVFAMLVGALISGWEEVAEEVPLVQEYRKYNLEDRLCMDSATAGRLRAIVQESQRSAKELRRAVTQDRIWVLTERQVDAAAKIAVAVLMEGENLPEYMGRSTASLVQYFLTLAPEMPGELAACDSSVQIRSAKATAGEKGDYNVEVVFTTNTSWKTGDELTVQIFCEEQCSSFVLTDRNMGQIHRVWFRGIQNPRVVRIELSGHQRVEGVFLLESDEESLLTYDDKRYPVFVQATAAVEGERILRLSAGEPGDTYRIYHVAALLEVLSGTHQWQEDTGKEMGCITVDEMGEAVCNFTKAGWEDGLYWVVGMDREFYVCLPQVDASGELVSSTVSLSLVEEGKTAS